MQKLSDRKARVVEGGMMMSEMEKALETIREQAPLMNEKQKGFIIGYGTALKDFARAVDEKKKAEKQEETQAAGQETAVAG